MSVSVILCWSGDRSWMAAEMLSDWLRVVFPTLQTRLVEADCQRSGMGIVSAPIEAGAIALLCLTRSNMENPWLHFEVGALARAVTSARLYSILVDLDQRELREPLSLFASARWAESDLWRVAQSLRVLLMGESEPTESFRARFQKAWPPLERWGEGIQSPNVEEQDIAERHDKSRSNSTEELLGDLFRAFLKESRPDEDYFAPSI